MTTSFTPIRISTLKSGIEIPFDLYIYFCDQYLQYLKSNNIIEDEKFAKLKTQKIARFYITISDEVMYQEFLDKLLSDTLKDDSIPLAVKVNMVEGAAQTAIENIQKDPITEANFKIAQTAAKNLRELLFNNPESLKTIYGSKSESTSVMRHSLNVTMLSIKFAEIKKFSDEDVNNLAIAGLMHDIGVAKLGADANDLFQKSKQELSPEERLAFAEHIKIVVPVLKEKPYITLDVIKLIENHEEVRSGTGPNKLQKLTPAEELLSMVNSYDKRVTALGISPDNALKEMMIDEVGNYDLELLQSFKVFLKEEGVL